MFFPLLALAALPLLLSTSSANPAVGFPAGDNGHSLNVKRDRSSEHKRTELSERRKQKRIVNGNLTPDGYYHNRYHGILAMALYGDYSTLCPNQTFTQAAMLKNFPDSQWPPWKLISTFGPTPSGCEGFTAIVPEMNKAIIAFKGNYALEQNLPMDVVSWNQGFGFREGRCHNCTVNRFAAQGYAECKAATNNWTDIKAAYSGQKLVFSILGHGLGGMHSLIASVDLNDQLIDYYSHNYGTPRTFNRQGANHYNANFNGEAGERGIYGNDLYTEYIPAGPDYVHTGTAFYYEGWNSTGGGPYMTPCFDPTSNSDTGPITDAPACAPRPQVNSTAAQDHYFYFANVGSCLGTYQNTTVADQFLATAPTEQQQLAIASSLSSVASVSSVASSVSVASISSMSVASVASVSSASVASVESVAATHTSASASSSASAPAATAKIGSACPSYKSPSSIIAALVTLSLLLGV